MENEIDIAYKLFCEDEQTIANTPVKPEPHGKVVNFRQEGYYDVTIYEDGYEDRFYVGD